MTDESLALKYRPTTFEEVVGQRENAIVLNQMVQHGKVPPGLMFSGPSGSGKTTVARILAKAMEATDIIEVDAASNGGVAEVRKLLDVLRYSTGGGYRVLILDEAHAITRQGWDAFLKTLEEPPAQTVIVLVTTEPHKIPEMIQSRVIEFHFRSVPDAAIMDRLIVVAQKEGISADPDLLHHLAQEAEGNARAALQGLDLARRSEITSAAGYRALTGDTDPAPALLASLTTGNHDRIFTLLDEQLSTVGSPGQISAALVECIRDLFVLKAGGTLKVTGPGYESRRQLALQIEQERLLFAVKTLWEVRTRIRGVDDPRGTLELALILISEAFTRGKTSAAPTAPAAPPPTPVEQTPPPRKLSFAELQSQ